MKYLWAVVAGGGLILASFGYYLYAKPAPKIISGLVIPHHDIVAAQRGEFLQEAAKYVQPNTIILVSPNHYDVGKSAIQTVDKRWVLSDGSIETDSRVIQELIANGVGDEAASFIDEHGVHLVLTDVHRAFHKANLIPLIIKSTATREDVNNLTKTLGKVCSDCLIVASVDFSHYQPALLADLHEGIRSCIAMDASKWRGYLAFLRRLASVHFGELMPVL
ncbi:MAG: AmmeMemoRadiSam system protein B [Candidatus Andersenbacteria bacterium RIFCSPHIGHO2_02_FULL_45_11]|uniref:AmmeMemoRadiSam system protein B n=1 Tax=Candidatus Andersenbacteria bacterium RIFCSPHIGHO2_12_FULL_45_11 TaxID=1797281 RepID=A0A1G1X4G9_9BACT|nr:MAG: AmmeMemoRadiSam system protein B [Candidatus Andersenbacteria bacterium RIFCSPHIGHO2_02_FULL_45_11]OGY34480.1 MAG: AmmeMemoRadiSam system protein B [Candidatus Andersenbacteria bacterium RIFCSPHIGHO2_12_FULL_45_11]